MKKNISRVLLLVCMSSSLHAMQSVASSSGSRSLDVHYDARANVKKVQSALTFILEHVEKLKTTYHELQPIKSDDCVRDSFEEHYQFIQEKYAFALQVIEKLENYFSYNDPDSSQKKNIAQLHASFNDAIKKLEESFDNLDEFNSSLSASMFIECVNNLEFVCNRCMKFLQDQAINSAIDLASKRDEEIQQGVNAAVTDLVGRTEYADQLRIERDSQDVNTVMDTLISSTEHVHKASVDAFNKDIARAAAKLALKINERMQAEQRIKEAQENSKKQLELNKKAQEKLEEKNRKKAEQEQETKRLKEHEIAQQKAAMRVAYEKEQEIIRAKKEMQLKQGDTPDQLQKFLDDANALASRDGSNIDHTLMSQRINLIDKAINNLTIFATIKHDTKEGLNSLKSDLQDMEKALKRRKRLKDQAHRENEEYIHEISQELDVDSWEIIDNMLVTVRDYIALPETSSSSSSSSSSAASARAYEEKEREVKEQEMVGASSAVAASLSQDQMAELTNIVEQAKNLCRNYPTPEVMIEHLLPLAGQLLPFLDEQGKNQLNQSAVLARVAYERFQSKKQSAVFKQKRAIQMRRMEADMTSIAMVFNQVVEDLATSILSQSSVAAVAENIDSEQALKALLSDGALLSKKNTEKEGIESVNDFKDFVQKALRMNFIDAAFERSLDQRLTEAEQLELELNKSVERNSPLMHAGDQEKIAEAHAQQTAILNAIISKYVGMISSINMLCQKALEKK